MTQPLGTGMSLPLDKTKPTTIRIAHPESQSMIDAVLTGTFVKDGVTYAAYMIDHGNGRHVTRGSLPLSEVPELQVLEPHQYGLGKVRHDLAQMIAGVRKRLI